MNTRSSGLQTADGVITDRRAWVRGVILTPAAADATLILYDNPSAASGTVLFKGLIKANLSSQYFELPNVRAQTGIYADISGASAEFVVYFEPMETAGTPN